MRQNRHRPLCELAPMASAVLGAVTTRLVRDGRLMLGTEKGFLMPLEGSLTPQAVEYGERPPMASLLPAPN